MTWLWCVDCGDMRVFDGVPDGRVFELACSRCDAAVFVGDLPLPETMPVAAVA